MSNKFSKFSRASRINTDPPFTLLTGIEVLVVVGMLLLQQQTPGLIAEWSVLPIGGWEAGIYARLTAFLFAFVALFGIRAMRPTNRIFLLMEIGYLTGRISENRISHEPLTLAFGLLMLMFCIHSAGIIIRPNEHDTARIHRQERDEARAQLQRQGGDE